MFAKNVEEREEHQRQPDRQRKKEEREEQFLNFGFSQTYFGKHYRQ
jgi:hypothetical protein